MNIFVTNKNPKIAATHLDDLRLRKMILETAQLLSTAMNEAGVMKGPYKSTHINHPCSKWTRESFSNFHWLTEYFIALNKEYYYRFSKYHACSQYIELFSDSVIDFISEHDNLNELTPFVNCTIFKEESNTFRAYREALNRKWLVDKRPPKWTKRTKPDWNE